MRAPDRVGVRADKASLRDDCFPDAFLGETLLRSAFQLLFLGGDIATRRRCVAGAFLHEAVQGGAGEFFLASLRSAIGISGSHCRRSGGRRLGVLRPRARCDGKAGHCKTPEDEDGGKQSVHLSLHYSKDRTTIDDFK
jgi:hypothetical protein